MRYFPCAKKNREESRDQYISTRSHLCSVTDTVVPASFFFPFAARTLVRGGPTRPHRPRLVAFHSTRPPSSPLLPAHSFSIGPAVINITICFYIGSSRGTWRGTVCGRGLLAGNRKWPTATKRRRPTAMVDGPLQDPYHTTRTYCSTACRPPTHLVILVTAVAYMRAGPMVRATVATDFIFSLYA